MATSRARDEDETVNKPVIFVFPGSIADTRLQVFEAEFHAHSSVLKFGSSFFKNFMDSADKTSPPKNAVFQYDYVSVVDNDGLTWGLEDAAKVRARYDDKVSLLADSLLEITAMKQLLEALYNRSFELGSCDDLALLVKLADFYGALPVVSHAMSGVLLKSPDLISEIPFQPLRFLRLASKLRNKTLYKESMIQAAGRWKDIRMDLLKEPILRKQVSYAYASLCEKLDVANQATVTLLGFDSLNRSETTVKNIVDRIHRHSKSWSSNRSKSLARFYRCIYEDKELSKLCLQIRKTIGSRSD